jgi:hypothetical protein
VTYIVNVWELQEYTLDVTHFGVTLVWVTANSVWAFVSYRSVLLQLQRSQHVALIE